MNKLENDDKVFVSDIEGTRYTYRVFKEFIVDPTDLYVNEHTPGKNVLILQTCALPYYIRRLIARAELVNRSA